MLAQPYRLSAKEVEEAKKLGKIAQWSSFGIIVYDRKDKERSRFAIVISKKIHAKAYFRNKTKRIISEAVRQNIYNTKPGYSCVILVRAVALRKYTDELMKEVQDALKALKILK